MEPRPLIFHTHCGPEGTVSSEDQIQDIKRLSKGMNRVSGLSQTDPSGARPKSLQMQMNHLENFHWLSGFTPAQPNNENSLNVVFIVRENHRATVSVDLSEVLTQCGDLFSVNCCVKSTNCIHLLVKNRGKVVSMTELSVLLPAARSHRRHLPKSSGRYAL